MRKRNLQKAVVLLVCLAFLGLSASGLSAATTSQTTKLSFSLLLNRPALFLITLIPGLRNILNPGDPYQVQPPSSGSVISVKTTADIAIVKTSGKD